MALVPNFSGISTRGDNEQDYYICGRLHPQPATFIAAFISFTTFLFVTVFLIYAGYWYALPVLIFGSVGWIFCLRCALSRFILPFIVLLLFFTSALISLTILFIYFAINATGPEIFSEDSWIDQDGIIRIVYAPRRAKVSNCITAVVFATLSILTGYCAHVMFEFRRYIIHHYCHQRSMRSNAYITSTGGYTNGSFTNTDLLTIDPAILSSRIYANSTPPSYSARINHNDWTLVPPPYVNTEQQQQQQQHSVAQTSPPCYSDACRYSNNESNPSCTTPSTINMTSSTQQQQQETLKTTTTTTNSDGGVQTRNKQEDHL